MFKSGLDAVGRTRFLDTTSTLRVFSGARDICRPVDSVHVVVAFTAITVGHWRRGAAADERVGESGIF